MPRERAVRTAPARASTRFDRLVEFVNFALAVVLLVAAWVLAVEVLAWFDRHDRRGGGAVR